MRQKLNLSPPNIGDIIISKEDTKATDWLKKGWGFPINEGDAFLVIGETQLGLTSLGPFLDPPGRVCRTLDWKKIFVMSNEHLSFGFEVVAVGCS